MFNINKNFLKRRLVAKLMQTSKTIQITLTQTSNLTTRWRVGSMVFHSVKLNKAFNMHNLIRKL